jgi:subtilisin family serine protease
MDCKAAVYSNDYYDFIAEYGVVPRINDLGTCQQEIGDRYKIAHIERPLDDDFSVTKYGYVAIPNCYGLCDLAAIEASGILQMHNQPVLSLKGEGVLIGMLDTGIDYENQVFRYSDGTSRIEAIWDQEVESGTPPKGFIYGQEYRKDMIDKALAAENPKDIVPSTDEDGHGTYVASLAAGNTDSSNQFSGAAPLARIAMVKLKQAKEYLREFFFIKQGAIAYQENDILTGIVYLNNLALELNMPLVICISIGSSYGSHTGGGPVSSTLAQVASRGQRAITAAAGNESAQRLHYSNDQFASGRQGTAGSGVLGSNSDVVDVVELNVGENVTGFTIELWAIAPDLYSVGIVSPTGDRLNRTPSRPGGSDSHTFVFENSFISVDYRISDVATGEQLIFMRFQNPSKGLWNIEVQGDLVVRGKYNMWITMSNFLSGKVNFIRSNPESTVVVPSTTKEVMAVGAYDSSNNSLYLDSGRGYAPDGTIKPDFVAPGVDVLGAGLNNTFVKKTGTSGSAAIASGACALILQWAVVMGNYQYITSIDIENILKRGTQKDVGVKYPNPDWGFGKLDLFQAFNQFRNA